MSQSTERESTIRNKKLFLEMLEQSRGMVTAVCAKTAISRATYYVWLGKDKRFKRKVEEIMSRKPEIIEDRIFALGMEGNLQALKYLHERYEKKGKKQKSEVHIYHHRKDSSVEQTNKGFEDLVDEIIDQMGHIKK
jgi:hypothetical protein